MMQTLRRRMAVVFLSLLLSLGAAVAVAPAASAGECTAPGLCGRIYNPGYAGSTAFGIVHNWGEGYSRILYARQYSNPAWADTDGFYIGPGGCGRWGVWTPTEAGGYWADYFYNGGTTGRYVKVFDYIYTHHVTAWARPC